MYYNYNQLIEKLQLAWLTVSEKFSEDSQKLCSGQKTDIFVQNSVPESQVKSSSGYNNVILHWEYILMLLDSVWDTVIGDNHAN